MSDPLPLLDAFVPRWHFRERHALDIPAPAEDVWAALMAVTPGEVALLGPLFALRTLPARLLLRPVRSYDPALPLLALAQESWPGFVRLAERVPREIVLGTWGRFWKLWEREDERLPPVTPEGFSVTAPPCAVKAVIAFTIEAAAAGVRLTTETRVLATDGAAWRRFAPYWVLIRPGSGLLRRNWLAAVRRRAESARPPAREGGPAA